MPSDLESGNMLIMVLAHFQATNDPSLIQNYVRCLNFPCRVLSDIWLVFTSQIVGGLSRQQNSWHRLPVRVRNTTSYDREWRFSRTTSLSDGIKSSNQTNLMLKGIIGISAMSNISSANNERVDEAMYQVSSEKQTIVILSNTLMFFTHLVDCRAKVYAGMAQWSCIWRSQTSAFFVWKSELKWDDLQHVRRQVIGIRPHPV